MLVELTKQLKKINTYTTCPLCNEQVYTSDDLIYAKSKLHESFAHRTCYNSLFSH